MNKHEKIAAHVNDILDRANEEMKKKVNRALSCGALDVESWDEKTNPMIMPKIVAIALLEGEAEQYKGYGTAFEKEVKKEVKNLRCFV